MKAGTDLWYNTGEEEVTMKFTLPSTVKCFDDEGRPNRMPRHGSSLPVTGGVVNRKESTR